jgi:hypothetical protein
MAQRAEKPAFLGNSEIFSIKSVWDVPNDFGRHFVGRQILITEV